MTEMADLEEGEITDSDNEVAGGSDTLKNFGQSSSAPVIGQQPDVSCYRFQGARNSPVSQDSHSFRSTPQPENSSEDSCDTSDEDSHLWNCKRTKYINKLRMEGMECRSQSPQFINPLLEKHRASPVLKSPPKKKMNNIWGSVLQEQTLTQTMIGCDVDKDYDDDSDAQDRDVESYNYRKAKEDTRPYACVDDDENEMDRSEDELFGGVVDLEPDDEREKERKKRKRKRPVKERLGHHSDLDKLGAKMMHNYNKNRKGSVKDRLDLQSGRQNNGHPIVRPRVDIKEDDAVPIVVDAIVDVLNEPKVDLITRVVKRLGQKKSIQLLRMTEEIEDNGGMMIKNGTRRRSPGGVFLQLLKSDSDVTKADCDYIFEESDKGFIEEMKRKNAEKKARRKKWRQEKKRQLQQRLAENGRPEETQGGAQMDLDPSNSAHRDNTLEDSSFSEGEITPDTSGESAKLQSSESNVTAASVSCETQNEEDMLTITVGEDENLEL